MKYQGILFDLDGTVCNTLSDLAAATNFALQSFGLPARPEENFKQYVSNGAKKQLERAIGKPVEPELFGQIMACYLNYYGNHYLVKTAPYDGVLETLNSLSDRGVKMAVVTNKPHAMATDICKELFNGIFYAVQGNSSQYPLKPDPMLTFAVMEQGGLVSETTLFVGDSAVDIATAKNAGLTSVGVAWGFRGKEELKKAGADYIIEHPQELLKLLD